ncbi:MAG TPA: response regulator [Blastococcus sp.]|jgi:CheY-like chemotaxis protein
MGARLMVLLLDDLPEPRESMRKLLEDCDFSVIPVSNVETALKEISSNKGLNIFVTDINLNSVSTDKSGLAFANVVKRLNPSLPIAAYSAKINAADIDPAEYRAFDAYLNKANTTPAKTQKFVDDCVALAKSHQEAVSLASSQGIKIDTSFVEELRVLKIEIENLRNEFNQSLSKYIKKPDVVKHAGRMNILIGFVASIASIVALYIAWVTWK